VKILLCTPEYPPHSSGIGNVVASIVDNMRSLGAQIEVLTQRGEVNHRFLGGLPGALGLIPFWQSAILYSKRNFGRFDAVWFHSPLVVDLGSLLEVGNRVLLTFHTTYLGYFEAYSNCGPFHLVPYYRFVAYLEGRLLKAISKEKRLDFRVSAVSHSVARELVRNGFSRHVYEIPNGMNTMKEFNTNRRESRLIVSRLLRTDVGEDDIVALSVGRIDHQKRPLLVAKMFKKLNTLDPRVKLIMLGEGPLSARLRKEIADCRAISAPGYVSERLLNGCLGGANVFVSLSSYEGLPLSVLEACASELPLVLSDIGPHRQILDAGIGKGLLVDALCPMLDVDKVLGFIQKTRIADIPGFKVADYSKADFSWSSICEKYGQLLF